MEPQAPSSPSPESAPVPQSQGAEQQPVQPEVAPSAPTPEVQTGSREGSNQGPGTQLPTPVQPQPQPQAPAQTQPPADDKQDQAVVVNAPPIADDVDVIEKEWVDKAKQVVEKTKHDPHQQNKEVNALKADYLKKRYGKDIKVSDA